MKTKILLGVLGCFIIFNANAQITKKKISIKTDKSLDENFALKQPTENTDIGKPFYVKGYGVPGAEVEVNISPVYSGGEVVQKDFKMGIQNPYKTQHFKTTVDASGNWSVKMPINVKFFEGATERRIHIIAGQSKNGQTSKKPAKLEIKLDKGIKLTTQKSTFKQPLKITNLQDGQTIPITVENILGTGKPGTEIVVSLYAFASVKEKKSAWDIFSTVVSPTTPIDLITGKMSEKGVEVKEKHYATYNTVIDENGKWYVKGFASFGAPDWMSKAFIPFAWVIIAKSKDPNYREDNYIKLNLKAQ